MATKRASGAAKGKATPAKAKPNPTKAKAAKPTKAKAAKPTKAKATRPTKPAAAAAKRSSTGASFVERTAGFQIPADAFGLTRAPEFARSERAGALLGVGFPNMTIVLDSELAPLAGFADYKKRWLDADVVPRALLPIRHAVARAVSSPEALDAAVATPPEVELKVAVEKALRHGGKRIVQTIEGLFGSVATADAFLAAIAAASSDDLAGGKYENYASHQIKALGHVLLRVPAAKRTAHRATLAKVLERLRADDAVWRAGKALDVILNGRAGVERSGGRFSNQPDGPIHFSDLVFADDDPAWVASRVIERLRYLKPADREVFDIQLAVVGGLKVLTALRSWVSKFHSDQRSAIADQLSLVS